VPAAGAEEAGGAAAEEAGGAAAEVAGGAAAEEAGAEGEGATITALVTVAVIV
jgi:hypothetical protein